MAIRDRLTADRAAISRRTAPAPRSRASTATCISARCWWPTATSSSSISRASRPGRWSSAAPRTARIAMSRGCCDRSTMPRRWWTARAARARRICRQARRDAFLDSFVARATESFLAGYRTAAGGGGFAAEQALLDLFLMEKAAYEIVYEAPTGRPGSTCPCAAWHASPNSLLRHGDCRMNDVVIEVPGLSPEIAAQLADGTLRDPFAVLGPHDTGVWPHRARLPARRARRRSAGARRRPSHRHAAAQPAARLVRRPGRIARGLPPAHRLARRHAGDRGPLRLHAACCWATTICTCSTKAGCSSWRSRSAPCR